MPSSLDALTTLLGPTVAPRFEAERWNREPTVVHGDPQRYPYVRALPWLTNIETLLQRHEGPSLAYFKGHDGDVRELEVTADQALTLLEAGAAMMLMELDRNPWAHPIVAFSQQIARELGLPKRLIRLSMFIAPKGGKLRKHFDGVHVMSMQLKGRKRWTLAENTTVPNATKAHNPPGWVHPELRHACGEGPLSTVMPDHATEHVAGEGSVTFFPRGWWHATEALDDSIALSFGFEPPPWADLVTEALRDALYAQTDWRESSFVGRGVPERRAAAEARLAERLAELPKILEELDVAALLDRLDAS